jgi:hypothetical protein
MKSARAFFVVSVGVALAAACGGSSNDSGGIGPDAGGSSSSSGGGGGSSSSSSSSSGGGGSQDGAPINPVSQGEVPCGAGAFCTSPDFTCCAVAAVPGMGGMMGTPATNTCVASPSQCPAAATVTACSSALSCTGGEVCCNTPRVAARGGMAAVPAITTCAAAPCPMGATQICVANSECKGGQTCAAVGGRMICQTPACTATSCGAGTVCCTGAMGAIASCQATCPMGTAQICAVTADCPTPQVCGGAGAAMTCRNPPAPPCTAASGAMPCAAGMICCSNAGGGTCQMGAACGGGAVPLCATSADCTAPMVCRTANGMAGGALGCRAAMAPPPEGGVADTGAADVTVVGDAADGGG